MANVTTEKPKTDKRLFEGEAWYHYGLVPATGSVLFPYQGKEDRQPTLKEFDPADLWFNSSKFGLSIAPGEDCPIFVAKYRQRSSFGVTGCIFPTTSDHVQWANGEMSRMSFPGNVMRATGEDVEKIVKSCFGHFLRFKLGVDKMRDPTGQAEEHDTATGSKPPQYTEEQWQKHQRECGYPIVKCPAFNPRTDRNASEFVYINRVESEREERGFDEERYQKNPNEFHYRLVGPVTQDFFRTPPKSVAEMYTPEGFLK